jgi:hypothetical protein
MTAAIHVTNQQLREIERHRREIVEFLSENWEQRRNLRTDKRITLQALELLYVSAYAQAFGTEPNELPTRPGDQDAFLTQTEACSLSAA